MLASGYRSLSLWHDTMDDDFTPRPALDRDVEVDVAIVGGGYTGLWTAYHLVVNDPTVRVAVIEREVAGLRRLGAQRGLVLGPLPRLAPADGERAGPRRRRAHAAPAARHRRRRRHDRRRGGHRLPLRPGRLPLRGAQPRPARAGARRGRRLPRLGLRARRPPAARRPRGGGVRPRRRTRSAARGPRTARRSIRPGSCAGSPPPSSGVVSRSTSAPRPSTSAADGSSRPTARCGPSTSCSPPRATPRPSRVVGARSPRSTPS